MNKKIQDIIDMFFAQKQLYERGKGIYVPPKIINKQKGDWHNVRPNIKG